MTLHNVDFDKLTFSHVFMASLALHLVSRFLNNRSSFGNPLSIVLIASRFAVLIKCTDAIIGGVILPSTYVGRETKASVLSSRGWSPVSIPIENEDFPVELSGGIYRSKNNEQNDRWLLFLLPNGVVFEQVLPFLEIYSKKLDINVLSINYRGVGRSTGWPYSSADLVADGQAAVDYLYRNLGAEILVIHGWSIGGAVGGNIKCNHCIFVSDRSFARLSDVAAQMTGEPMIGAMIGSALVGASTFSLIGANPSFIQGGIAAGGLFGAVGGVAHFVGTVLTSFGWEMDIIESVKNLSSGDSQVIILYHKNDGMVPYETASLDVALRKLNAIHSESITSFEITSGSDNAHSNHMFMLSAATEEFQQIIQIIQDSIQAVSNAE